MTQVRRSSYFLSTTKHTTSFLRINRIKIFKRKFRWTALTLRFANNKITTLTSKDPLCLIKAIIINRLILTETTGLAKMFRCMTLTGFLIKMVSQISKARRLSYSILMTTTFPKWRYFLLILNKKLRKLRSLFKIFEDKLNIN